MAAFIVMLGACGCSLDHVELGGDAIASTDSGESADTGDVGSSEDSAEGDGLESGTADAGESGSGDMPSCEVAEFVDPLVEAKVREVLGLPASAVLDEEALANLTVLDLEEGTNLSGLECANGLVDLRLATQVVSLAPVSELPVLNRVRFEGVDLSDPQLLGALASTPGLTALEVRSCVGVDLAGFEGQGCPELFSLRIVDTPILSPDVLGQLSSLRRLTLTQTSIVDIDFVSGLPKLIDLDIGSTSVSDLSPLAGHASLLELYITGTDVTSFASLATVTDLTVLAAAATGVTDLSPLAQLASLEEVLLSGTLVSDLSPLAGTTTLTFLDVSVTQVTDLSVLTTLPNLVELRAIGLGLTSLPVGLSVRHAELHDNALEDLSPLLSWGPVDKWSLGNNAISDLGPLADLPWSFFDGSCHMINLVGNPLAAPGNAAVVGQICPSLGVDVIVGDRGVDCWHNCLP